MDTSPVHIVCCNQLDTAGEVLSRGMGGGMTYEIPKQFRKAVLGTLTSGLWRSRYQYIRRSTWIRGDGSGSERHPSHSH
jgi:hypothetical protein